jgi:hypothetical protein
LHLIQPTISRDIDFIRSYAINDEKRKDLPHRMYYEQEITLDSVGELMKYLWSIIDNPKIEVKERIKAMNLMLQYHYMRARLIGSGIFEEFSNYAEKVENDEEANKKEKKRKYSMSLVFIIEMIMTESSSIVCRCCIYQTVYQQILNSTL